jgi:hypothetical protein
MNQSDDKNSEFETLKKEQLLMKEKLELLTTLFDDISKMYFKLEEDLFLSGKIKEKYSDNGFKYEIQKII